MSLLNGILKKKGLDREGNPIGDGSIHADYFVYDIPGVETSVSFSNSSESVYVNYYANGKKCTCRFSWHNSNSIKFGDDLNGNMASKLDIMTKLGFFKIKYVPEIVNRLSVPYEQLKRNVAKKMEMDGVVKISPLTIQEVYARGEGADLSDIKGKIVGERYLITGDTITSSPQKTGYGWDVYYDLNGNEIKRERVLAPRKLF